MVADERAGAPGMRGEDDRPAAAEPPFAERARTLVHLARLGTLATQSKKAPGYPFASLAPYALDERGRPLFFFSSLAMHTQNLLADDHASLFVAPPGKADDALAAARVTLLGRVAPLPETDVAPARDAYVARHAAAAQWVGFKDFSFYRMEVEELYYVAGFGAMGWVGGGEYCQAAPDPLADDAAGILAHMNTDHADAVALYCRALARVEADSVAMTAIDRLGFQLRAATGSQVRHLRLAFPHQVRTAEEARRALIELLRDARARR
jgi:putative heme iron utilization protein